MDKILLVDETNAILNAAFAVLFKLCLDYVGGLVLILENLINNKYMYHCMASY